MLHSVSHPPTLDSCDLHARGPPAPCARGIADCFRSPAGVRVLNPSGCTAASSPTQRASGAMQCAHPAGAGPGGPRSAAHRCRSHVFSAVEWIMQSHDATSIQSARFLAQPPSSLLVHSGLVESLVGEPGRARGARPVSEVLLRRLLRLRGGGRLACGSGAEEVPHRRGLRPLHKASASPRARGRFGRCLGRFLAECCGALGMRSSAVLRAGRFDLLLVEALSASSRF